MFINFARKLFEILVSNEFSYIKQADNRLIYETEALSLYNDKGSILYIVSIINAEIITDDAYHNLQNVYLHLFDSEARARLILMNVVVNDREGRFTCDEDYLPGKNTYIFSYGVDLEANTVAVPEEQPELMGMEAKIKAALSDRDESYVNGTHLASLESELSETYALPAKSGNIYLTLSLIVLNTLLWALMELSGGSDDTWTLILYGAVSNGLVIDSQEYYRLFTAMFLHIGAAHLANNCLALYIYGSRVEKYFGKIKFAVIYFISGVVGNIITVLFMPNLSAGASGAIFGLLGALMSVVYRTGRSVDALSPYLILLLSVSSIGLGLLNPAVNNYAHVAGFLTGIVLGGVTYRRFDDAGR